MTMAGRNRFLAIFYHESMPLQDGTQKLGYMLYDAVANKTLSKGPVSCISLGSSLAWVGFSNDCSLMAMDSDGMLSMLLATSIDGIAEDDTPGLSETISWEWAPLLDTVGLRKSSDDTFWPVMVYDGKLVCIPLKGGTQYPDAGRRPVTTTLSMRMPLARSTIAKSSALEELAVRSNIALVQKRVNNQVTSGELMGEEFEEEYRTLCAQVVNTLSAFIIVFWLRQSLTRNYEFFGCPQDKVTLKLFAATVEAGKLERALDLVERLQLEKSYELAMKIADNHDKLVDLIEDVKERKFAALHENEQDGYAEDDHELDYDHELEYNAGNNSFDDNPGGTSPEHSMQTSRRISPENNSAGKGKRTFDQYQPGGLLKRKIRPKA